MITTQSKPFFEPPARLEELDTSQKEGWSEWISKQCDNAVKGYPEDYVNDMPRSQFYNASKMAATAEVVSKVIKWTGCPQDVVKDLLGKPQTTPFAQDEFCEFRVVTDGDQKIKRITFTCESPEYWEYLAAKNPVHFA